LVFKLLKFDPKDLLIDNNSSINIKIMNFLSIDCSTEKSSLFVKTKNKTFIKVLQSDKFNNDLLMKQILDFFEENNIKFSDLSKIFVNQGPGNFSSLRGSLATAKGISLSKKIHLYGYNTFVWSCTKFFNKKNDIYSLTKFRDKYFVKRFDKSLKNNFAAQEIDIKEIIKKYDNKFKIVPKNIIREVDKKILQSNNLNIVELDHAELEFLQLKGLLDQDLIKPLYLS